MPNRRIRDAIRHRAPRTTAAVVAARQRFRDRSSPYAALDRAHQIGELLGPGARIEIDQSGVWLRDADGCYWSHVPGVYGPFLGLERGLGFETVELEWAAGILSPGSVLVDIGANIGVFCINLLRRRDGVSALAVEPVGRTYRSLEASVSRNGLASRITAIRAAVGEAEGEVLITSGLNAANHIVPRVRAKASTAEEYVRQTSLDSLVTEHELQRLDLLKIDVEGFELGVLKGARETLRQFRPAVLLEIEARWTGRYGYAPSDIFAFMASFGYDYRFFTDRLQAGSGNLAADLSVANNFVFLARAEGHT